MSDNTEWGSIRFTQSARRHRIGRASARHVMATCEPVSITTSGGVDAWLWIGPDERGRELEIIGVQIESGDRRPHLLVIHVMPTRLKG